MAFTRVATTQEVPADTVKQVTVAGRKVALFNLGGTYYAIEDNCPHRGAPLSEGVCEGTQVVCPWHGWEFDPRTGAATHNPAARLAVYPIKIEGDDVLVEM